MKPGMVLISFRYRSPVAALEHEVDAREARAADRQECRAGDGVQALAQAGRQLAGLSVVVRHALVVLGHVVVELATGEDLARAEALEIRAELPTTLISSSRGWSRYASTSTEWS